MTRGWFSIIKNIPGILKEWEYDEQAAVIRGDKDRMENIKQSIDTTEALVAELKEKSKETQSQILDNLAQTLLDNLDNIKIELDKTEQEDPRQRGSPQMPGQTGYNPYKAQGGYGR